MATQSSTFFTTMHSCCSSRKFSSSRKIKATLNSNRPNNINISTSNPSARNLPQDLNTINSDNITNTIGTSINDRNPIITTPCRDYCDNHNILEARLFAVLEAIADRIEMHTIIGEQRGQWNSLLLNSINTITLTATTMAGLAEAGGVAPAVPALKLSSGVLFAAATGLLMVVNKLQPSQLVEEQRTATRLFKQLLEEIKTMLALDERITETDVDYMMERVLALDKAYPLPLIGVMLDKFPEKMEPSVWWPLNMFKKHDEINLKRFQESGEGNYRNGWNDDMEREMREIAHVLDRKDKQDYIKLGNKALKLNRILSILGPFFTGVAACGTAFLGSDSFLGVLSLVFVLGAGALAGIMNSIEHGGQVGMVFEMYRNNAGYFQLLKESIESVVDERELERRENGELMELKVALQLGRNLTELKDLAEASASSRENGGIVDDFANKLF